jgi:hypothetical protein
MASLCVKNKTGRMQSGHKCDSEDTWTPWSFVNLNSPADKVPTLGFYFADSFVVYFVLAHNKAAFHVIIEASRRSILINYGGMFIWNISFQNYNILIE